MYIIEYVHTLISRIPSMCKTYVISDTKMRLTPVNRK